jgi:hypothetical protein
MHFRFRMPFDVLFFSLIAGVLGCCLAAHAQGAGASLTGTITDPSGASVSGATVTLTNVGTNATVTSKSDATGVYLFRLIPPGNYALTITSSGFARYKQTGITLHVSQSEALSVQLTLAQAQNETVSVTADAEHD